MQQERRPLLSVAKVSGNFYEGSWLLTQESWGKFFLDANEFIKILIIEEMKMTYSRSTIVGIEESLRTRFHMESPRACRLVHYFE